MPFRLGLGAERRKALEKELERIVPLLIELGVRKIVLFGSLSAGKAHRSSDIDLLIVRESDLRFLDRSDELRQAIRPRVAIDFFIYTPLEFEEMMERSSFVRVAVRKGRLLYDAGPHR